MAAQNVDWESVQTKYWDIMCLFLENYPSPEDADASGKEFPHGKKEITKAQVSSKLKAIRGKYRRAIETGRKTGCGRVILLFFELCGDIWGGSSAVPCHLPGGPETADATYCLPGGIESADLRTEGLSPVGSSSVGSEDEGGSRVLPSDPTVERHRPHRATSPLASHRIGRLKRKLSPMLIAQEELELKRRMFQRLEDTDHAFLRTMKRLAASVEQISSDFRTLVQHMTAGSSLRRCQSPLQPSTSIKDWQYEGLPFGTPAVVPPPSFSTQSIQEADEQLERGEENTTLKETQTPSRALVPPASVAPPSNPRIQKANGELESRPKQLASDSQVDIDQVHQRTEPKEKPTEIFAVKVKMEELGDEMPVSLSPDELDASDPSVTIIKQEMLDITN